MSDINLELNEITKFRLHEITKIKEYFNNEIKERKDIINKINKYIVALLTLIFTMTTAIVKKLLSVTKKKRKRNIIKLWYWREIN